MDNKEVILHLENLLEKLTDHVAQQDAEIFRLSKRIDAVGKQMRKLEKQLQETSPESPLDSEEGELDERPPHY